jgi:DNA-binding NarL/FixJ family response regulator
MNQVHKILIVDDHVLFRQGLVSLFNNAPDFLVVSDVGSIQEVLQVASEKCPDIILLDFSLPDGNGAEATRKIKKILPDTKIVILTMHEENEILMEAIRSGASGYLLKNIPVTKLLCSLRGLEQGEAAISRQMTAELMRELSRSESHTSRADPAFDKLTHREVEIMNEVIHGMSNEEISSHLYISISTVKNHIGNILKKLGLRNRRELNVYARQHHFGQEEKP